MARTATAKKTAEAAPAKRSAKPKLVVGRTGKIEEVAVPETADTEETTDLTEPTPSVEEDDAAEETETEPAEEVVAVVADAEITDFDNLLDLARAVDAKFGSEAPKEGTQHFMERLLTAVSECEQEQWDSLSASAQDWYEAGVVARRARQDVEPPVGYASPAPVAAAVKSGPGRPKKEATEAGTVKAPRTAKVKTPRATKVKEPKAPKVRNASKTMPVRLAVSAKPTITLAELIDLLPDVGRATLSTTRSDTLATLEAMRNTGWKPPA